MSNIRILSTRKLRPETIAVFEQMSVQLEMHSFINIEYLPNTRNLLTNEATLIITSVHGIEGLVHQNFDWRMAKEVFCIAGVTVKALRSKIAKEVPIYSALYASDLLQLIIEKQIDNPLILVKGNKGLATIPIGLDAANISYEEWIVYKNEKKDLILEKEFEGILFFSPSAVESFVASNRIKENTITFALGSTTAAALKKWTKNVVIAETTSELSMAHAVASYFNI